MAASLQRRLALLDLPVRNLHGVQVQVPRVFPYVDLVNRKVTETPASFGTRVKRARQARDWTVRETAAQIYRVTLKRVTPGYVTRIERGQRAPRAWLVEALSEVLGLSDAPRASRRKTGTPTSQQAAIIASELIRIVVSPHTSAETQYVLDKLNDEVRRLIEERRQCEPL